jgi:hypothetical protein
MVRSSGSIQYRTSASGLLDMYGRNGGARVVSANSPQKSSMQGLSIA